MRVLAAALRGNIGDGPFEDLQQSLLDALPGDIASDGGVFIFLGDFVDLVDVDDPLLGAQHVAAARLQQFQNDVFHVLAHITGFGERGGVGNGEGDVEHPGQGLCQQGLARAGGADEQDVGLGELHVVALLLQVNALVMVIDGHRQPLLGLVLADHVLVQKRLGVGGLGEPGRQGGLQLLLSFLLFQDALADGNALVADVGPRAFARRSDQAFDTSLTFMAKGATQRFFPPATHHNVRYPCPRLL